jgi:hypothetical protein
MTLTCPAYASLALAAIPDPDYADMSICVLPAHATADPAAWARNLFSLSSMPKWIVVALALRQALAPLMGIRRAPKNVFAVRDTVGDEALIAFADTHLDFAVGVGVSESTNTVRVTTTVRLKNIRGRLYFLPVRLLHPFVVQSMLKRSRKVLSGVTA